MSLDRKLRYGMVGGGPGAFIGAVHRMAAALDGKMEIVAGVFSSDPEKSRQMGEMLHLDSTRVYGSYEEMAECEATLPEGERIDFVVIVTPNYLHYPVARTFIERGFHVVCDKPLTTTLEDAEALCRLVARHHVLFALTHNYSGYPMVKEARERVQRGDLGVIRKVVVEYSQGWLATPLERTGHRQAAWRTDPQRAGAGALGDIGSHAEHLARYITGLTMERLYADVHTFIPGRQVEDDAQLFLRYANGARGLLVASQIAVGEENNLNIRIYGERASLAWYQEEPNALYVRPLEGPEKVLRRGNAYLGAAAQAATRLPPGHPEGFIEAFANIYRNFGKALRARLSGEPPPPEALDFPTVQDGARGVHFILKALESGRTDRWVDMNYEPPNA